MNNDLNISPVVVSSNPKLPVMNTLKEAWANVNVLKENVY